MIAEIKELSDLSRTDPDTPAQITIDLLDHSLSVKKSGIFDLRYHIEIVLAIMDKSLTNDINILNSLDKLLEQWQAQGE